MKGYSNYGQKSWLPGPQNIKNPARGTARTSYNASPFFSQADEYSMEGSSNNTAIGKEMERLINESEETQENKDLLRKLASLKYKDILNETL